MPIKVTMRYHSIPTTMSEIQDSENSCPWSGCGAIGTLTNCWWECKMEQPLWKKVWQFLTKLNIVLPYDPAIAFLSIENLCHTKTCTQMFIAGLFITAKTGKQPRCPSANE